MTARVPGGSVVKNRPALQKTQVLSLDQEGLLEKEVATHSSTLAWKIPGRGVAKSRAQPTDFTFTFHLFATELDVSCGLVLYTL